ncbi:MAG: ParB/Srx family N-terminal domain-containing protein [Alphaproteobacteria bacterium]|nr:ParB/Srx family N-terminal domain-containing protein [Alphaproteobacteria bacterium]
MTAQPKLTPQAWPAAQVEIWQVADLVPFAKNARQHPPEQINQIAASMERFGFTIPMLVAEDGTIIAGHGRLMAAAQLGLAEVPVPKQTEPKSRPKPQKRRKPRAFNKPKPDDLS